MLAEGYRFLKKVSYKDFYIWDVKRFQDKSVIWGNKYPIVTLNKFLSEAKIEKIKIEDTKEYPILGVRTYGKGVYFNRVAKGSDLKMREYQKSQVNHLFWCKVDTKNGAFGVINEDFAESFGSTNMTYLKIDVEQIMIDYLQLFFAIEKFQRFVDNMVVGVTNRKYISKLDLLNKVTIPLPTTTEQKAIVTNYNTTLVQAEECEAKAKELEESIDKILFEELGIVEKSAKATAQYKYNYLEFIDYKSVEQWGLDFIGKTNTFSSSCFRQLPISSLCNVGSGGTPSRNIKEYYQGSIPWIKTGEVLDDIIYDTEEKISELAIQNSSAKLYPAGSLIIAMYGQGKTRGRTAKLGIESATNQACSVLSNINNSIVDTDFLWLYLQSQYERLRSLAYGNNQPNLTAQMIKDYPVILPPLEIQQEISQKITKIKTEIKELRQKAESLRIKAKSDFEREVFSE